MLIYRLKYTSDFSTQTQLFVVFLPQIECHILNLNLSDHLNSYILCPVGNPALLVMGIILLSQQQHDSLFIAPKWSTGV